MRRIRGARAVTLAVVLALVGAVLLPWVLRDRDATPPDAPAALTGYSITYELDEIAAGTTSRTIVEVDRPYRARTRTYDGATGALRGGSIVTEDHIYSIDGEGRVGTIQPVLPARAGPDVRLSTSLPEAVAAGLISASGHDEVAGIACTIYESSGPLDSTLPAPPTEEESAVSCVDDAGRILRDEWHLDGRVTVRRVATEVRDGITLSDDVLFGETEPEPIPGGFELIEILPMQPDDPTLAFPFPDEVLGLPRDLTLAGEDLELPNPTPMARRLQLRATYTDGVDLIIITQSRAVVGPEPDLPTGEPFALAPLQDAVVTLSFDGVTVTGMAEDMRVEIRSTLPRARLAELDLTRVR